MNKVDIKIIYSCNNHCLFCIQWEEKRIKYWAKSLQEIQEILLTSLKKSNTRQVVFTGGEPTLHPQLLRAIEYAKAIGYIYIFVQSNWQNFSDLEFCLKLKKAGITHFAPSIHWFYPKTHDLLTQTEWAWMKVVQWIRNAKKIWSKVTLNIVVTKQNYKEMTLLSGLLCKLWIDSFQFAFPHIGWSAKVNALEIIPRKTDIMPYIKGWIDIAKKYWIPCLTEAIPYCLMRWYETMVGEQYLAESSVHDAEYKLDSYTNYRLNEWKIKQESCKKCSRFRMCEWPWKEYPEMYGWEEFIPY